MTTDDKASFIGHLAEGNPLVDLDQIRRLEEQLAELRQAGISTSSTYALQRPLAQPLVHVSSALHDSKVRSGR